VDVFDNSSPRMLRVAIKRSGALTPLNTDRAPAWVQERLVAPCRERAAARSRMETACRQHATGQPCVLHGADIRHGQSYCGVVVDADEQYILQCTGANTYLLHDRALCPPVSFNRGASATFPYFYEKGGKHRAG
ncbi:MAG: hypothetical protein J6T92_00190, partial [Ottowia sp.]|nr:hypothetical protein [Ottowia sp.]